jgi:predicted Rossmann fold flavoprotein
MVADAPILDAIILGGGAAGLMCAIEAGKRGRKVAVLERAPTLGKKILISGGGRCNFTNLHCQPSNFLSANPHFAKSVLARYPPADFIALVEKHGIPYHEKTLGQLFCDRSARDILAMLESECRDAHVQLLPNTQITEITHETGFTVRTANAEFRAPALVVATGGLSIPKMGASGFGYDIARQFGLKIIQPRPALVPLVFNAEDKAAYCDLAGVSTEVVAALGNHRFREKMLITHSGLSGPAILQISSYWTEQQASEKQIRIDLAPERNVTAPLLHTTVRTPGALTNALQTALPSRLASRWVEMHKPPSWTNHALADWERELHGWKILPAGTEGFEKAEVTAGGVNTDELSAKTLESKKVPGLYFIGEVVDVTGHLGGFNFQWAWASGAAAGRAL